MDVTKDAFKFAELRRHLWNAHFFAISESLTSPQVRVFLDIQKLLFKAFVLEACKHEEHDLSGFGTEAFDFLVVKISEDIDQLEIYAASSRHPTKWSKRLVKDEEWNERTLHFIDFFDWYPQDPKGRCSYPFVEVESRLKRSDSIKERWLIPNEYVSVWAV